MSSKDLIYCDPPYMLSEAVYNEKRAFGGWCKQDSLDLLSLLEEANRKNFNFALSEMLVNKGEFNNVLSDWIKKHNFSVTYNNVKYLGVPSTHKNEKNSVEVLVTNY